MSILWPIFVLIVFLVMISVLVAAHELGHYLFARLFGMGVEEFAIGMGKRLTVWRRSTHDIPVPPDYVHEHVKSEGHVLEGGTIDRSDSQVLETPRGKVLRETTEFTVRALPIGGFVRIKGMVPAEDGSEVRIPGGFYSKPPLQRLVVLIAGPLFSVLAGIILLFSVISVQGMKKPADKPIIDTVYKSTPGHLQPAWEAGMLPGDEIVSVNNKSVRDFYEFVLVIQDNAKKTIPITFKRRGKLIVSKITPDEARVPIYAPGMELTPDSRIGGRVGVGGLSVWRRLTPGEALYESVRMPLLAVQGIVRIVKQPSRLEDEAGGALTMARVTSDALKEGVGSLLVTAALISISVGVFNLLPVPPLDGGQMLMAFAELLRGGKRLSMKVQQYMLTAGFAAVVMLTVVVLFIDFKRLAKPEEKESPPSVSMEQPAQTK